MTPLQCCTGGRLKLQLHGFQFKLVGRAGAWRTCQRARHA